MSEPKKLWAAMINSKGLYNSHPICVIYSNNLKEYWDKEGDFSVKKEGLSRDIEFGYITFAHKNKEVVEAWIGGVSSCMSMLKDWSTIC